MKLARLFLGGDTVRQAVVHTVAAGVRLLHERTILVLLLLFCLSMGCMLWYVSRLQSNLIASISLQDASLYAQALAEFRTLYTSEVVETVRAHGIEVTHDYMTHAGAIPLPVTLTMLLGKRIGTHEAGAQLRLYSPIHFPSGAWRAVCATPLARQPGTPCSATPPRPFTVLRMSRAAQHCAMRRRT